MKTVNNRIYCNICGAEFAVTKDTLTENEVTLVKEGSTVQKPVTLTWLPTSTWLKSKQNCQSSLARKSPWRIFPKPRLLRLQMTGLSMRTVT